jgi:hypothetical protein
MGTQIMNPNGYYTVNGIEFDNKIAALIRASELNTDVKWHYFDNVFENAKKDNLLVDTNIEELYKIRAQQLRDSYDYLILNYSGGSDSHNVLHTFLKNNIKLDCIYVQWPERLMDNGLFTVNTEDKTNANFHSEWELVLKKDLQWLAQAHPEIKIELFDWLDCVNEKFYTDAIFEKNVTNLPSIARSIKQNNYSKTETEMASKGKRVASIFGIDKPYIVKHQNKWYCYLVDTAFMAQPNPNNPTGLEYFYNTPAFPELTIIQCKKLAKWYDAHPEYLYLVKSRPDRIAENPAFAKFTHKQKMVEFHQMAEIAKLVCYPHWDFGRFQAEKPFSQLDGFKLGVRAWDNILITLPGWERAQQAWEYHWTSYLDSIDSTDITKMRSKDTVAAIRSKQYNLA